jgi:cytidine deaminase
MCAERSAIFSGVTAGFREIQTVALACLDKDFKPSSCFYPCGACLQVISEFARPNTQILLNNGEIFFLRDLLPTPFTLK